MAGRVAISKRFFSTGTLRIFPLLLLAVLLVNGCATSHKYRKYRAVPCPCEKTHKR